MRNFCVSAVSTRHATKNERAEMPPNRRQLSVRQPAILIDHAPARAPQLVAYQRIITSASNHYPLAAWLNYDIRFRMSDPSLRWDVRLTDLWLECFFKCTRPYNPMALCTLWCYNPLP